MSSLVEARSTKARVRKIVLDTLAPKLDGASPGDTESLYEAGMDSHASVDLMIALESQLGLEFPNRLLTRSVFNSIDSIASAVETLSVR